MLEELRYTAVSVLLNEELEHFLKKRELASYLIDLDSLIVIVDG